MAHEPAHGEAEPQARREQPATTPSGPAGAVEAVRDLQRRAGNRAVARVVAEGRLSRQAADPVGEGLEPADEAHAQVLQDSDLTLTGLRVEITGELLALVSGQGDASEPPLLKADRKTATYGKVEGTPFAGATPSPADVKQGGVGDCYLLAALAALAKAKPAVIEGMIKDNGDGTYDVTLYKDVGGWFSTKYEKRVVKVTNTFPLDKDGNPVYAKKATGLDGKVALWVMLIEKAYAQREGGYDEIEGGDAGKALEILTGRRSTKHELDDYSLVQIEATLKVLTENAYAITASPRRTGEDSDLAKEQDTAGIVRKHAYTLLRYDQDTKHVILRNPWGFQHPRELTLAEFKKYYRWFESVPTR